MVGKESEAIGAIVAALRPVYERLRAVGWNSKSLDSMTRLAIFDASQAAVSGLPPA